MKLTLKTNLILLVFIFSCSKSPDKDKFILYGELNGVNTEYLIIKYFDNYDNPIKDTIIVRNNKFFTTGFIKEPTLVSLEGNKKSNSANDPNTVRFFIEPVRTDISLIVDKFKDIKVNGSITQIEYEGLEKQVAPIYSEISLLKLKRDKLQEDKNIMGKDSITIDNLINNIDKEWAQKLDDIVKVRLKFAWNNPNSFLSIYWMNRLFTKIPIDSVSLYFDNLDVSLRNSSYGMKTLDKISKRNVIKIDSLAPKFKAIDLLEREIKLESFQGKYVLLDFWAAWCKPCRKNNPNLRKLYKKYNKRGFEIISISLDDYKNEWQKAIKNDSIGDWHHIFMGRRGSMVVQYNINEIPDYILIDKKGYIIGRKSNGKGFDIKDIEEKLKQLIE